MINNQEQAATGHGTIINPLVFRHLDKIQCHNFVSCYLYHKPNFTFVGLDNDNVNTNGLLQLLENAKFCK